MSIVGLQRTFLTAGLWLMAGGAWAAEPCDCLPPPGAADVFGAPPPPAIILEPGPCLYKPHDLDPCYNMRCDLAPGSHKPSLYVTADFVPLFRDALSPEEFQAAGVDGPIVVEEDTLKREFQGGLRFLVGGRMNELYRVESSFLGFQFWDVADAARDFTPNALGTDGSLFSPFTNFGVLDLDGDGVEGVPGVDYNHLAAIRQKTSYDSVESNFIVDLPRIRNLESSAMIGGRYLLIDEEFAYRTESFEPAAAGGSTVAIQNAVGNELFGLQLGYRGRFLLEDFFWLDFDIRGAMYHNNLDHRLQYQQTQGGAVVGAFADDVDNQKTTWGGDISLISHYLLTPNVALRLGYQALWFDGLALAAGNIIPEGVRVQTPAGGPNAIVFPPLEIDHSGSIVLHGPVAGITAMW